MHTYSQVNPHSRVDGGGVSSLSSSGRKCGGKRGNIIFMDPGRHFSVRPFPRSKNRGKQVNYTYVFSGAPVVRSAPAARVDLFGVVNLTYPKSVCYIPGQR